MKSINDILNTLDEKGYFEEANKIEKFASVKKMTKKDVDECKEIIASCEGLGEQKIVEAQGFFSNLFNRMKGNPYGNQQGKVKQVAEQKFFEAMQQMTPIVDRMSDNMLNLTQMLMDASTQYNTYLEEFQNNFRDQMNALIQTYPEGHAGRKYLTESGKNILKEIDGIQQAVDGDELDTSVIDDRVIHFKQTFADMISGVKQLEQQTVKEPQKMQQMQMGENPLNMNPDEIQNRIYQIEQLIGQKNQEIANFQTPPQQKQRLQAEVQQLTNEYNQLFKKLDDIENYNNMTSNQGTNMPPKSYRGMPKVQMSPAASNKDALIKVANKMDLVGEFELADYATDMSSREDMDVKDFLEFLSKVASVNEEIAGEMIKEALWWSKEEESVEAPTPEEAKVVENSEDLTKLPPEHIKHELAEQALLEKAQQRILMLSREVRKNGCSTELLNKYIGELSKYVQALDNLHPSGELGLAAEASTKWRVVE